MAKLGFEQRQRYRKDALSAQIRSFWIDHRAEAQFMVERVKEIFDLNYASATTAPEI